MEREFKHTPGPWHYKLQVLADGMDDVGNLINPHTTPDYYEIKAGYGFHGEVGRVQKNTANGFSFTGYLSEANAKLIAASPSMLQTLERIANCNDLATAQEYARDAINKATS